MKVGATLLFKDNNSKKIKGILKSVVVDAADIKESTNSISDKISRTNNYSYLGINDLFSVSGEAKAGELLGRATFYELNTVEKSKSLLDTDDFLLDNQSTSKMFNCSLIYFCENADEKFTISILSIVESNDKNIIVDVELLAKNYDFLEKIKSNSLERIEQIEFIGIEMICKINLNLGVFQSFSSEFNEIDDIKEELLSNKEIKEILADILE